MDGFVRRFQPEQYAAYQAAQARERAKMKGDEDDFIDPAELWKNYQYVDGKPENEGEEGTGTGTGTGRTK